MKYKNELGEWVTINVRALDSLPVGTELEYDGNDIPVGWEEIENVIYADDFKCKNMFNKEVWQFGYISDTGEMVSSTAIATFGYIEVNSSTTYSISLSTTVTGYRICYYDNTRTFISRSDNYTTSTTITTPSNARYIRIFINVDNVSITQAKIDNLNYQVELGSTATTYTSHKNFDNTWKYLGQTTGNTSIDFPIEYSEIYAEAILNNDALRCFSFTLISSRLTSSAKYYNEGFYVNNSLFGFARIMATNTAGSLNSGQLSGTDVTSSSVTTWYYR